MPSSFLASSSDQKMREPQCCSRLCRLIDDSLRSYRELEVGSVTKEKDKEILLSLSQVFRGIQLWNQELDSDSESGSVERLVCEIKCLDGCSSHSDEIQCLSKIVAELVYLLTVNSQYVRHLASNVLLVVSELVAASGSNWEAFIQCLCFCLDLGIRTLHSDPLAHSVIGADDFNSNFSSFVPVIKDKLKGANWSALAGIMRVLRYILKHLTPENDFELICAFFDSINSCLSNVHWDSLTEIFVESDGGATKSSVTEASLERLLFLGNFVQFLCSLVDQSGAIDTAGSTVNKHPVILLTIVLVPKLLGWFPGKQGDGVSKCIIQYIRHKLLVLMIRLSVPTYLNFSTTVSWLQLVHNYFGELLWQPITPLELVQNDSLQGSPFLSSMFDEEVNNVSSPHVQRRAIFLFLRCSFSLINLKGDTVIECTCTAQNLCLPNDSNVELECCGIKRGFAELYHWLQGQDDLLFRVLLLLLSVPFPPETQFQKEKVASQDEKHDMISHVSNIFNPVHLFHLFLSELHYDHQVLLDYLISKDTGISCAEYLLRCLRTICGSWHFFVQFSANGHYENQLSYKKRKFLWDNSTDHDLDSSVPEDKCVEGFAEGSKSGGKQYCLAVKPYKKARECLLSLRVSVESLHNKNLFPYNPKVLLKRLWRFEELCLEEDKQLL
ncbi:uncharacterized protein LOC133811601 isoform X2 [Humulus lupulus]|uniref:uncharacterized protein LOC133811601 isoform X2 n=1 Tax=Humulus lupulus TaxID=3486 RepID=UPI002B40BCB2|nr:uncharacterized protein LOC133811601 isoform X2 [Humulus lupulus]